MDTFLSLLGTATVVLASVAAVLAITMLVVYQLRWLAKHWNWPPLEPPNRLPPRTTADTGGSDR